MDGELKVTLAIYSGRRDPVWTIHSRHNSYKGIKDHLHNARASGTTYRHEHMPSTLGYKGFLVHHPGDEQAELIVDRETVALQELLLDTMPGGLISDVLRQKIVQAIHSGAVSANVPSGSQPASSGDISQTPSKRDEAVGKIQHYAPKLNLARWNNEELIRYNNNCYNYGNDKITNSFAQPGEASGHPIGSLTPEDVLLSAESDGLQKMNVAPTDPVPEAPQQPNCLVSLAVAEGVDYHWYRLDDNGLWSHKPGGTSATNLDGKGNLISDPRKAANNPYGIDYKFVSFMKIFTNIIE
ncbi:uncharacterized protein LOC144666315 [Oculina patagonica]